MLSSPSICDKDCPEVVSLATYHLGCTRYHFVSYTQKAGFALSNVERMNPALIMPRYTGHAHMPFVVWASRSLLILLEGSLCSCCITL